MEKNITEETVKVGVMFEKDAADRRRNIDFCSIWLLVPENRQILEEREEWAIQEAAVNIIYL